MSPGSGRDAWHGFPVLASLFLLYFSLGLIGYGNDNDTYGMLKTWSDLFRSGVYSPSRAPGYPLPEIAIGAASQAGGWAASNALSALLACGALFFFHRLVRASFGPKAALLSVAATGLNPYFIIAASSSMDYVYAMFFFLAGISALAAGRFPASGILFALCAASRLTYAPLIALAYAAAVLSMPRSGSGHPAGLGRPMGAFLLFLVLGFCAYLPAWISMGSAMFHPTLADAPVSLFGFGGFPSLAAYAIRFVYKNAGLWGYPSFAVLAFAWMAGPIIRAFRGKERAGSAPSGGCVKPIPQGEPPLPARPVIWAAWAGFFYAEALFFRLPLEINYLMPVLFLVVFLVNRAPRAKPVLAAIALLQAVQGLVQVDFIEKIYARRSYESVEASGVRVRLHAGRGVVWEDAGTRRRAQAHYLRTIVGEATDPEAAP